MLGQPPFEGGQRVILALAFELRTADVRVGTAGAERFDAALAASSPRSSSVNDPAVSPSMDAVTM